MKINHITVLIGLAALGACGQRDEDHSPVSDAENTVTAKPETVSLMGADGAQIGEVTMAQDANGTTVTLDVSGPLAAGMHGVHLHEAGLCDAPEFSTAGGHWNPTNKQHGRDNPEGAHTGDLSNLSIGEGGTGNGTYLVSGVLKDGGEIAMADADGTALVIHEGPDDYVTDPSGDSGSRVGCAVLAAPKP